MKKNNEGFTLVELLATILIISVILGIATTFLLTTINKAKDKSLALSDERLEDTANLYIKEFPDEITWQKENSTDDSNHNTITCISLNTLINKGYYTTTIKDKINNEYIIITKDSNNNIINTGLDQNNQCDNLGVKIPTKEEYCQNFTYNKSEQTLTKEAPDAKFTFLNNKQTNAGIYEVKAHLEEGYHWQDGSNTDKSINCQIKKATPTLTLNPTGIATLKVGQSEKVTISTTTSGTIKLTSSNKDYLSAQITSGDNTSITAGTNKTIQVTALSSRNINSFVTVTLIPDDQKNYYTTSTKLLINKQELTTVPIPTEKDCLNPYYDGTTKTLVKSKTGIIFNPTEAVAQNKYTITAQLKYGYIWSDGTKENKKITCEIRRMHKITLDSQGATTKGTETLYEKYKEGIYLTTSSTSPTTKITVPTKTNHKFMGYYTDKDAKGTKLIDASGNLTPAFTSTYFEKDATIYAKWVSKATLTCDNSKYGWSNTVGKVDITANNANSHFGGIEYRAGHETTFGKTTNTFYQYSKNNVYHVLSRATDDEGNILDQKWCTTKFDNLKPYTPTFFGIEPTKGATLESETCSSLSKTSTSNLECTVTIVVSNNSQGFSTNVSYQDQPATNCSNCAGSGQSGFKRVEATFKYYNYPGYTNRPDCTDSNYVDNNEECDNFLVRKFILKAYDNAGNVSATSTINVIFKPNHLNPNQP